MCPRAHREAATIPIVQRARSAVGGGESELKNPALCLARVATRFTILESNIQEPLVGTSFTHKNFGQVLQSNISRRGAGSWFSSFLWSMWSVWSIWSVWFIWLVSFNPRPDRPDRPERLDRPDRPKRPDRPENQASSSTREKPRATGYGFFAHRNPGKYKLRNVGGSQYRSEDRRVRELLFQEPPRITLNPPVGGPVGFFDGLSL